MATILCSYCGKDITGRQISNWPLTGYCCRDCYYTKHTKAIKEKYSGREHIAPAFSKIKEVGKG